MTLASRIAARTRRPTMTVWLNGRRWAGALFASVSQDYGSGIASAQLVGRDPPVTPVAGMAIRWTWGYDGIEQPGFSGYLVNPGRASYPNRWDLQCADALWPAQRESQPINGGVAPYNNITARAAIEYILATYAGGPRTAIPDIKRPSDAGTNWTLGQLTPVQWTGDTTALAACQEIAQAAGHWLYADAGGTVRTLQLERRPSGSPLRTFQRGVDLLVQGAPTRQQPADQVRNRITVRGASTGVEGAQLYDTFEAPHALLPGVTNSLDYQSFLLEYEADITAVAARIAAVWNRVPNIVEARIKADPRLSVGATVAIQDSAIGYRGAQTFFIYRLATTIDLAAGRFDQQLTLDGGTGNAGFSTIPNPVAVIVVAMLETETLDSTASAVVRVDGSGSMSLSGGEIVSYAWSTSGVTSGTPSSASGAQATFIYPASASPVTITLTVTDTTSKTDSVDLVLDLAAGDGVTPVTTEALNVAFGAAQEATANGGATWREYVATTTRVPPIGAGVWASAGLADAATYGLLASGGMALRQSLDFLATAPTSPYTAPASITALSVNARNAARVWLAAGDTVYRSTDGGATFSSWGQPLPGTDVVDILEDPAVNDSVFCLAGADFYQSIGPSPAWAVYYAGPVGATARWMQRSASGDITWLCYTGTFSGSPLQRIEGAVSVTFPVVSPTVDTIRAIALLDAVRPAAPQLIAIDQAARIWQVDGLTGAVSASAATFPVGSAIQHAAPSQSLPLVYVAAFDSVVSGTGAVYKYFPEADALLLYRAGASGRQAHMVGLASVGQLITAEIILLPFAESGAADRIFRLRGGLWEAITPPQAGWRWRLLVVSPFAPDTWVLLGNVDAVSSVGTYQVSGGKLLDYLSGVSPVWVTTDAGATWEEVELTGLTSAFDPIILWPQSGGGFVVIGGGELGQTLIYRLTTESPSGSATTVSGSVGTYPAAPGQSTDTVAIEYSMSAGALRSVSGANALSGRAGGATVAGQIYAVDRLPNSRATVTLLGSGASSDLLYSADYGSAAPAEVVPNVGATYDADVGYYMLLAAASHGVYVGNRAGGVLRVTDIAGSPTTTTPIGTGTVGAVAVDDQTRSVVAVLTTNQDIYYSQDGETWAFQTRPPDAGTLAHTLAVVVRTA